MIAYKAFNEDLTCRNSRKMSLTTQIRLIAGKMDSTAPKIRLTAYHTTALIIA